MVFSMTGASQLRSIFEEGVLAHQPIDGGLAMGIQIFSEGQLFLHGSAFSPIKGLAQDPIASPSVSKLRCSGIPILAPFPLEIYVGAEALPRQFSCSFDRLRVRPGVVASRREIRSLHSVQMNLAKSPRFLLSRRSRTANSP